VVRRGEISTALARQKRRKELQEATVRKSTDEPEQPRPHLHVLRRRRPEAGLRKKRPTPRRKRAASEL